jgi:hypothetical protein
VIVDGTIKSASENMMEKERKKNSELIRQELLKLKKMKQRQQKEIENMIKV